MKNVQNDSVKFGIFLSGDIEYRISFDCSGEEILKDYPTVFSRSLSNISLLELDGLAL